MSVSRVMVTGGLGVNGSWVVRRLVEAGIETVVFDLQEDTGLISDVVDDVNLVRGDICDLEAIERTIKGERVERIVHMAAMLHSHQQRPHDAFAVNAMGSVNVLEAARDCGARRVVFASSRAVYGGATGLHAHPTYEPISEEDPVRPRFVYETCKVAVEGMGRNYADSHGLEFVALRFAHIVGPGKGSWTVGNSLCSKMIDNAIAGIPTTVDHGGDQRDDIIYAADVGEGARLATVAQIPGHRVFNISRGVATTLGELADAIKRTIPEAEFSIGPGLDYMDAPEQWYGPLDNSRARAELGFEPAFDLDSMVADYIARTHEGIAIGGR
jgi:UDP-glucose 4-epimerase